MSIEHLLEYPELCPATFLVDHNGWIIAICYLNVHIWDHQNSVSSIYTEKKSCFFPHYIYTTSVIIIYLLEILKMVISRFKYYISNYYQHNFCSWQIKNKASENILSLLFFEIILECTTVSVWLTTFGLNHFLSEPNFFCGFLNASEFNLISYFSWILED